MSEVIKLLQGIGCRYMLNMCDMAISLYCRAIVENTGTVCFRAKNCYKTTHLLKYQTGNKSEWRRYLCTYICICMYVCVYVYVCMYVVLNGCMFVRTYASTYISVYLYIYYLSID